MHMQSRRLALCGVLCALAEVCLLLGGLIPAATYCCPILAALVLLPVREECGMRLALTAWAAVAMLALLLVPDQELAGVFLFFGWYPVIQPTLDRIPFRFIRIVAKLLLLNSSAAVLYAALIFVFHLDTITAEFFGSSHLFMLVLWLLGNLTFLATDAALHKAAFIWRTRLRKNWFKQR